jgi:hypothetical protein
MQSVLASSLLNTEGTEAQRTQRDFEVSRPGGAGPLILSVIPAKAGIHAHCRWIPAFAGMTCGGEVGCA